jgi:hypothetical protein
MPNGLFVRVGPHLPAIEAIPEYTSTLSALQNTIALQAQKNHPDILWHLPEKVVSMKEDDYVMYSYDYSEVDPVLLKTDAKNASIARANTALAQFTQYKKIKTKIRGSVYIIKVAAQDANDTFNILDMDLQDFYDPEIFTVSEGCPIVQDQFINKPEPADAFGGNTLIESFKLMSKAWRPSAQLKPFEGN